MGCAARFDYHAQFVLVSLLPGILLLLLSLLGLLDETIRTVRVTRGTLDETQTNEHANYAAALFASQWPASLPCDSLGDLLTAIIRLLGLSKPGAMVGIGFTVFDGLAPMVLSAAVRVFDCEQYDDGTLFLRADLSIECNSDTRKWMAEDIQVFGIVVIVLAVVITVSPSLSPLPSSLSQALLSLSLFVFVFLFWGGEQMLAVLDV